MVQNNCLTIGQRQGRGSVSILPRNAHPRTHSAILLGAISWKTLLIGVRWLRSFILRVCQECALERVRLPVVLLRVCWLQLHS